MDGSLPIASRWAPVSLAALRQRWEAPQARRHAAAAMAALLSGRRPSEVGFPDVQGRVDLRGLVVPEPAELRRWSTMGMGLFVLERVADTINLPVIGLRSVDFGEAFLPHVRFNGASLANCSFDGAHLPDLRTRDATFDRCSFRAADLAGAAVGPGSRFQSCHFGGARLRGVQANEAAFTACEFGEADLLEDDFNHTVFDGCHFAGLVKEVRFRADSWHLDDVTRRAIPPDHDCVRNCDFSQAQLRSVSFEHLNLKGVRFPDDDAHLALADVRCVLLRLRHNLAGDASRAAHQLILRVDQQLATLPRSRSHGYLSLADLAETANHAEAELVIRWVREAAAACAQQPKGWLSRLRGAG
jgi:uncharacterized protein YjbI with pentapeptide repeats